MHLLAKVCRVWIWIKLSQTQDKECGDGMTSMIVLGTLSARFCITLEMMFAFLPIAGEILTQSLSQLKCDIYPVVIILAYNKVLQTVLEIVS